MRRTKLIIADDGERKIEIFIRQEMKAEWNSEAITNKFEDTVDNIVSVLMGKYHLSQIKVK